jgi:hypothetical protein
MSKQKVTDTFLPKYRRDSELRELAIEKDAQDPDFLANLSRLGPVRVDHHMQTVRLVSLIIFVLQVIEGWTNDHRNLMQMPCSNHARSLHLNHS